MWKVKLFLKIIIFSGYSEGVKLYGIRLGYVLSHQNAIWHMIILDDFCFEHYLQKIHTELDKMLSLCWNFFFEHLNVCGSWNILYAHYIYI